MSKESFSRTLNDRLTYLAGRIDAAERRRDSGELDERVKVAGELAVLRKRVDEVSARLDRLAHEPDGAWQRLKTEIEADLDAITVVFERMMLGI